MPKGTESANLRHASALTALTQVLMSKCGLCYAARRARILRDGQLTMIVYGDDEALKWQLRIGKFFGVIR